MSSLSFFFSALWALAVVALLAAADAPKRHAGVLQQARQDGPKGLVHLKHRQQGGARGCRVPKGSIHESLRKGTAPTGAVRE